MPKASINQSHGVPPRAHPFFLGKPQAPATAQGFDHYTLPAGRSPAKAPGVPRDTETVRDARHPRDPAAAGPIHRVRGTVTLAGSTPRSVRIPRTALLTGSDTPDAKLPRA